MLSCSRSRTGSTDRFRLLDGRRPHRSAAPADAASLGRLELRSPHRCASSSSSTRLAVFAGTSRSTRRKRSVRTTTSRTSDILDILERWSTSPSSIADLDGPAGCSIPHARDDPAVRVGTARRERRRSTRSAHGTCRTSLSWGVPRLRIRSRFLSAVAPEMQAEIDNYRAATRWARAADDAVITVRLATQLGDLPTSLGQRREAHDLIDYALESAGGLPPGVLARAWNLRGWTMFVSTRRRC